MSYRIQRHVVTRNDVWLLDKRAPHTLPDFGRAELIYRGEHTRIWRHPDVPDLVSKVALVQTAPRDALRKYAACQARREFAGIRILKGLGLNTPTILGHGFTLSPCAGRESILFMRELPPHRSLRMILRNCPDEDWRAGLLTTVASQFARIYGAGFHHKDCHFENVLLSDAARELIWIDSDIRRLRRSGTACRRFQGSLEQLFETSRRYLATREWREFVATLAENLQGSERGRHLAEKVLPDFRTRVTG